MFVSQTNNFKNQFFGAQEGSKVKDKIGEMGQNLKVQVKRQAAAFCTSWRCKNEITGPNMKSIGEGEGCEKAWVIFSRSVPSTLFETV